MKDKELIHISVLKEIKTKLKEKADEKGKTLTNLIIDIFEDYLKRNK